MHATEIPIANIYVLPDFNPRRHFDETKLNELADSIKSKGVIQPIVVRREPADEGEYHLVAGERRLRAASLAGLPAIPAVVRACSLLEAREIAMAENEKREGVSAGEEALAAQKVLDALDGDKAIAAKELGWSRTKLDSRLLLLHAVTEVLDALAQGVIFLGHAERLAGLPQESQVGTLKKVIEDKITVADLGRRIEGFAYPLASACFDTAECNGCPHNSKTQMGLFSEPLREGLCQNRVCFAEKTQVALEARRKNLSDDFNVVVLATEKPGDKCRALLKDGSAGVGQEQFSACQQCAHFGARIENRLNGKTGTVVEGLCFNTVCNDEKQADYQAALKADAAPSPDTAQQSGTAGAGAAKGKTKAKAKANASSELTKAAKVVVSGQVRAHMPTIVSDSPSVHRALVVEALVAYRGVASEVPESLSDLPADTKALITDTRPPLDKLCAVEPDLLDRIILGLASELAGKDTLGRSFDSDGFAGEQLRRAMTMLTSVERKASEVFTVDGDFLKALPKAAISALLDEVGFKTWFLKQPGEDREKAYKALLAEKKADLPAAIMASDFDWTGIVPKQVQAFLKKP